MDVFFANSLTKNQNKDGFMIKSDSNIDLSIINSLGKTVKIDSFNAFNNQQILISNLANGIYL